jgi:hypothetical protein
MLQKTVTLDSRCILAFEYQSTSEDYVKTAIYITKMIQCNLARSRTTF